MLSGRGLCDGPITRLEKLYTSVACLSVVCECDVSDCDVSECDVSDCGVSECDFETSTVRILRPTRAVEP